jgi:pimeloyl-ACP methyl ester carboxylesterase
MSARRPIKRGGSEVGSAGAAQGRKYRMTTEALLDFVEVQRDGAAFWRIARRRRPASQAGKSLPGYVWLGGFASDMRGAKASFLDARAVASGRAMLRFDYSGHGESAFDVPGGRFEDGSIGDWLEQSLALFLGSTEGPQIVIGSSMGAWLALLLAQRLEAQGEAKRLLGLLLIAPAVDFTEELMIPSLSQSERRELMEGSGEIIRPAGRDGSPPLTRRLLEEGRRHLLLGGELRSYAPVRILQGVRDEAVPWRHAFRVAEKLAADPAVVTLVADGDHRLSRPEDMELIAQTLERLEASASG